MSRLGPVEPINRAIDAWRQSLVSGRREPLPADLRRRLWEPIEQALPPGTTTVYLCPDDALTRLPWTALPGRKPGTVLLENYALAVVPNGQVLLERLLAAPESAEAEGSLLAVGGVDYQAEPRQTPRFEELASAAMVRSAALDTDQAAWPNLPGTRAEVEMLVALAEKRPRIVLSTTEASTTRVLQELPHARWAHFATHGFFADKKFRSALQLDEKVFERATCGSSVIAARWPGQPAGAVGPGAGRGEPAAAEKRVGPAPG